MSGPKEPALEIKPGEIGVSFGDGPQRGRVVRVVGEPAKWHALDPKNAALIAVDMLEKAAALGVKAHLLIPRPPLSPIKYQALVTRVGLVMRNQLEKRVDPKIVARQIVDIVLSGSERL